MSDNIDSKSGEGLDTPDGVELTLSAETSESTEASYTGYITILLMALAVVMFGRIHFNENSSGLRPDIFNHNVPWDAKAELKDDRTPYEKGMAGYKKACVACHQVDGNGLPGQFPPLAGSEWVNGPKEISINVVLNGLAGPIEVKGTKFNGAMPPLGGALSDEQFANILTFVRGNKDWGNESSEVTAEDVKAVREAAKGKGQWNGPALLKLHPLK